MYEREILQVYGNGILITCPGITDGQLIVCNQGRTGVFAMVASSPNLERVQSVFDQLIQNKFASCIPL